MLVFANDFNCPQAATHANTCIPSNRAAEAERKSFIESTEAKRQKRLASVYSALILILNAIHTFVYKCQRMRMGRTLVMNPIVGRVAQSDSGLWLGTMLLLAAAAVLFLASNDQKVFGQPVTSTSKKK